MEEKWKESRMLSLPATFTYLQREHCEMLSREDPMMEENIWVLVLDTTCVYHSPQANTCLGQKTALSAPDTSSA